MFTVLMISRVGSGKTGEPTYHWDGTFSSIEEATEHARQRKARSKPQVTYEVWTGTIDNPGKPTGILFTARSLRETYVSPARFSETWAEVEARGRARYDEARDWISDKIRKLVGEGKDQRQAIAIALNMARKKFPGKVAEKDAERYGFLNRSSGTYVVAQEQTLEGLWSAFVWETYPGWGWQVDLNASGRAFGNEGTREAAERAARRALVEKPYVHGGKPTAFSGKPGMKKLPGKDSDMKYLGLAPLFAPKSRFGWKVGEAVLLTREGGFGGQAGDVGRIVEQDPNIRPASFWIRLDSGKQVLVRDDGMVPVGGDFQMAGHPARFSGMWTEVEARGRKYASYDVVYFWAGGHEAGEWKATLEWTPGMAAEIRRQGRPAVDSRLTIGAPEGPPTDAEWEQVRRESGVALSEKPGAKKRYAVVRQVQDLVPFSMIRGAQALAQATGAVAALVELKRVLETETESDSVAFDLIVGFTRKWQVLARIEKPGAKKYGEYSLPTRIGDSVTIPGPTGRSVIVKKIDRSTWFAIVEGQHQGRFGDREEIRADIDAFLEMGGLPRSKGGPFFEKSGARRYFDPVTLGVVAAGILTAPLWTGLLRRAGDVAGAIRLALFESIISPEEAEELRARAERGGLLASALARPSLVAG